MSNTASRRTTPRQPRPQLSLATLNLCCELLSQVTLRPTADDFMAQAKRVDTARTELLAALEAAGVHAKTQTAENTKEDRQ